MEVKLFKKKTNYKDVTTGEEKTGVRFYVKCNEDLIPVETSYFGTDDKKDKQYSYRKAILNAFADELPDKPVK